jgi:hypothetical protein
MMKRRKEPVLCMGREGLVVAERLHHPAKWRSVELI